MPSLRYLLTTVAIQIVLAAPTQAAQPAEAAAVAMTTDVQGTAWLVEGDQQSKLGLMAYLPSGAKLKLDKNARVSVTYFAVAREYTLNGPSQATVDKDKLNTTGGASASARSLDQNQVAAGKKFTTQQRERQALATFEMKAIGSLSLHQPVNTKVLGTPTEFSWQALLDNKAYHFTLSDAQGRILHSGQSTENRLQLPKNVQLQAGKTYTWSIESVAKDGQKQSASAEFTLLDENTTRDLNKRQPKASASFSERLLYATMLENAGAQQAATIIWQALANERPDDETLQQLGNR